MTKYLLLGLMLAIPAALHAQERGAQGPRGGQGRPGGQGIPGGFFPWWDSPLVDGLDLSDAQRTQILAVVGEYRGRMLEARNAVQKAESDLEAVFNEETVDQRRGSEAISRLTRARADMTQSVSEMSLRMRAVLTSQQWQDLQRREQEQRTRIESVGRGPGSPRGGGRGRRPQKAPAVTPALKSAVN